MTADYMRRKEDAVFERLTGLLLLLLGGVILPVTLSF